MLGDLAFDASRVGQTEAAFESLGRHLGFAAERPDKLYRTGPDVLWTIRDDLQLVIELKTGVTRPDPRIKKAELDQLSGHLNWHAANYGSGASGVPVLVHPESRYLADATPPAGTRVLTPACVEDQKRRVEAFANAISVNDRWKNEQQVQELLTTHQLLGRDALLRSSETPSSGA
ncbi:hypothetical protein A8L33_03455 [Microbacterium aurantiacum]|nr:hypothetical protein A8L33_03455 [Microbacterium chocolatum]